MKSLSCQTGRGRPSARRVRLTEEVAQVLCRHARNELPAECCGFLIGFWCRGDVDVADAWATANAEPCSPGTRFLIPPEAVLTALRRADSGERELVGFYHSHPDGSQTLSGHDTEKPWFGHVHLIVSAPPGGGGSLAAWAVPEARSPGRRLPLEVTNARPRRTRTGAGTGSA